MFFKYLPIKKLKNNKFTAPGIIANPVSGKPRTDDFVIILKSHANANSKPPPRAKPSTTAKTGWGKFAI